MSPEAALIVDRIRKDAEAYLRRALRIIENLDRIHSSLLRRYIGGGLTEWRR